VIRIVEERFGCIDLGFNMTAGSRKAGGSSVEGSVSARLPCGDRRSVLGVDEGWSEVNS
ncbi:hypothetical protein A2U01_0107930, partial [Trifolium medium]|nr:hypothetical protein [Trifolium medium]